MAGVSITHSQPLSPPNHKNCDTILGHPHILTVRGADPEVPAEVYNRSLVLMGHGIPLFTPGFKGDRRVPKSVIQRGLTIGDVGVVDRTNGAFEYFFNIFLRKDHPDQYKIPDAFTPFVPAPQVSELRRVEVYHKAGTVIASSGVEISLVKDNTNHFTYTTDEIEGAILVLPQGASREDIIDPSVLDKYIAQHATMWYQHINPYGDPYFTNGTLTVVTGCDKARDWAMAVFPAQSGDQKVSGEYHYQQDGASGTPWVNMSNSKRRSHDLDQGMQEDATVDGYSLSIPENQCVFLRGTTISINNHIWPKLHASYLGSGPFHAIIRLEKTPLRKTLDSMRDKVGIKTDTGMIEEEKARAAARGSDQLFFQPAFPISEALLKLFPKADFVLINDRCWLSLVEGSTCMVDEVNELISRVFEAHEILEHDGTLTLVPRPERPQMQDKDGKKKKLYGAWASYSRLKHAGFEV